VTQPGNGTQSARQAFHELHRSGCFVLPNPWDIGSARYLESLQFKALATTSSGFAWTLGRPDYGITRDVALAHFQQLCAATRLPVNADYQNGFAHDEAGLSENVRLAIECGVAGLSIEDASGDSATPLYDFDTAVARIRAARTAIDRAGGDTLLVARAEGLLYGQTDIEEIAARLTAFGNAGADCLYAPGALQRLHISRLVAAVAPKPLNVLVHAHSTLTVKDIAELGVRRISVGGALARTAWGAFMRAATLLAEQGSFQGFLDAAPGQSINALFADPDSKH
jgi:2-methylisocitrate lyase-like PEP mutase family enzyme